MSRLLALAVLAVSVLCTAAGMLALLPGAAEADVFGPISLVSQGTLPEAREPEQGDYVHDPAISGDGRYVAFDGSFGGLTGVWRRDLQTGEVLPVAVEDLADPAISAPDAELPSISENGRYVSFTTTARLDPVDDTNEAPDVYVRDMDVPVYPAPSASSPAPAGAFTLASAVNGSAKGLAYQAASSADGSLASGRSALSADGRHVVFVTTAISDLLPAKPPALPETPETPALQVAVRDLDTQSTRLVSVAYDPATGAPAVNPETGGPEPVSGAASGSVYGAVDTPGNTPPAFPFSSRAYKMTPPVGASISADASTVAWLGQDVSEQARMLPAETVPPNYTEPLWRRIVGARGEPSEQVATRRVTGGSDPANPACVASGETVLTEPASPSDPCQGPFLTPPIPNPGIWGGGTGDAVPQLSADGMKVAFLATAELLGRGANFGVELGEAPSDLYVVDMHEGLTRDQALTPLTEFAGGKPVDLAENAPIIDLGISPDGTEIAFTTMRTTFPLGSPAYVSAPAAVPGMVELLDVDLADDTLTRVTQGYEGGPSEQPHREVGAGRDPYPIEAGALSPSFADNGNTLAFSSTASNLVYGDGNTPSLNHESIIFDGADAFVVSRVLFGATPTPQEVSTAPGPSLTPVWNLGVSALSRPNGSVLLYVQAPGAGTLRAGAQSAVVTRSALIARSERRARRASASRVRLGGTVATRTVATRETDARGAGLATLTLALAARYRSLARERGGLSATVTVTFTAPGRPALRESVPVIFLRRVKRSDARSHQANNRSRKAGRRS